MPPESSAGYFAPSSSFRPTSSTFTRDSERTSRPGRSRNSRIGISTFCPTVSEENSAPNWKSTPQRFSISSDGPSGPIVSPNASISPGLRLHEAEDRADQHGFSGARRADDGEDFSPPDIDVEVFQHRRAAEADGQRRAR